MYYLNVPVGKRSKVFLLEGGEESTHYVLDRIYIYIYKIYRQSFVHQECFQHLILYILCAVCSGVLYPFLSSTRAKVILSLRLILSNDRRSDLHV